MREICIFNYRIIVERFVSEFPIRKRARRKLARWVEAESRKTGYRNIKIGRVKIARCWLLDSGVDGPTLNMAKEWVEIAFADNGTGEIV